MNRRELLCYAGGFFDGEGTINLSWSGNLNKIPCVRICVYNTAYPPLEVFVELFDGKVRVDPPRRRGWKPVMYWGENSRPKLVKILKELLPFIREPAKRKRIEYFLSNYQVLDRAADRAKPLTEIQQRDRIAFIRHWPNLNSATTQKLAPYTHSLVIT